jgi:uncharacterized membrane protein YecN with MAPEG domain
MILHQTELISLDITFCLLMELRGPAVGLVCTCGVILNIEYARGVTFQIQI